MVIMSDGERLKGLDFNRKTENRVGVNVKDAVARFFDGIDLGKPGIHGTPELPYTVTVRKTEETLFDPAGYLAVADSHGIVLAEVLTPSGRNELARYTLHIIYPHHHRIGEEAQLEPVSVISKNSGDPTEWLVEIETPVAHDYGSGNNLTRQDGQRLLEQHGLL